MTPLRQRMIEDMKLRNFAPRTIQVYVERVATFAKHFGKSPDRLGPADVRAYLLYLVNQKHASLRFTSVVALLVLRSVGVRVHSPMDGHRSSRSRSLASTHAAQDDPLPFVDVVTGERPSGLPGPTGPCT